MLLRISLIVAILTGLAAGVLNFLKVKEKIDLVVSERNDWHNKYDVTTAELNTTKADLARTERELDKTKEELVQTQQERAAAVAEVDTLTRRNTDLTDKLNNTIRERDDARANLAAYVATGYTPEQIVSLDKDIKAAGEALQVSIQEKAIIQRSLEKAEARIAWLVGTNAPITMRADLKGNVLVTDPKWDFVVLNVGEDEGAKLHGELLVSRQGKLVAKVIITEVRKERSIANVLSGWKIGEVFEGDMVIPAHPES